MQYALYSCTVFCRVYRLRSPSGKLPREHAKATARDAWLEYTRLPSGAPVYYARLADTRDGAPFAELSSASVRFVRRGGIMISGFELKADGGPGEFFTQSWWCVPIVLL